MQLFLTSMPFQSFIPLGTPNYINGRSPFHGTLQEAELPIRDFGGKGSWIEPYRERVNFGFVIGTYVNYDTGAELPTAIGIIHYSKTGSHNVLYMGTRNYKKNFTGLCPCQLIYLYLLPPTAFNAKSILATMKSTVACVEISGSFISAVGGQLAL